MWPRLVPIVAHGKFSVDSVITLHLAHVPNMVRALVEVSQ